MVLIRKVISLVPYIHILFFISAVHNEVTYQALNRFKPENELYQTYKQTALDSPGYSQAGSFFPDW